MRRRVQQAFFFLTAGAMFVCLNCFSTSRGVENTGTASREVLLSYAFTVKGIPPGSSKVNIWVPIPPSDSHQKLDGFKVICPYPYNVYTEPEYGNRILKVETGGGAAESIEVKLELPIRRTTFKKEGNAHVSPERLDGQNLKRYLAADRLVPIDGQIAAEARRVVKPGMSPLAKAKAIYAFVVETMTYDKSGTGWGRGDALYACDARRGNCTDFHSLFIGMARASGVPARFVMGFSIPAGKGGEIPGYHCWAEFYVGELGWIPVDASEASKNPEKKEFFFGNLDANRVAFTLGRDISLDAHVEPLNYLIYPFVLVDGRPHPEVRTSIRFAERLN